MTGASTAAGVRVGVPGSQLPVRDVARAARIAEEDGFDSIWFADRLMGWLPEGPHALLDPVPVMAVSAAATATIRLGTAVVDVLRRHPAQLAQTALTLQHLSAGRLLLGLGCGELAGTVPYGIPYARPVGRFDDALDVMRALLTSGGRPVSHDGPEFRLRGALLGLAATVAPPPLWVAAHGPRMLRITGERGDGWLPTAHGVAVYAAAWAQIAEAARAAGRPADAVEAGAFVWLVAAESRERARSLLAAPSVRALGLLLPAGSLPSGPLREGPFAHLLPTDPAVHDLVARVDLDELAAILPHGNPEDIAAELTAYVDAGARHLVICDMAAIAGEGTGLGMRTHEVHVAVRDALRRRLAARA